MRRQHAGCYVDRSAQDSSEIPEVEDRTLDESARSPAIRVRRRSMILPTGAPAEVANRQHKGEKGGKYPSRASRVRVWTNHLAAFQAGLIEATAQAAMARGAGAEHENQENQREPKWLAD